MTFSNYSTKERIKAFYSLWFDVKPYIFSDHSKWQSMSFLTTNNWDTFENYMYDILCAAMCMRGIGEEDIVGDDSIDWCFVNKDKILVVYCGEEFNLEMKYDSIRRDFVYRSFKH